jgi:hypothetical protein
MVYSTYATLPLKLSIETKSAAVLGCEKENK